MKVHLKYNDDDFTFDKVKSMTFNASKTALRVEAEDAKGFEYIIIIEQVRNFLIVTDEDMPHELKAAKYALPTKADEQEDYPDKARDALGG